MTVTLTIEEVRAYQESVKTWATSNALLGAAKAASSNVMESSHRNPIVGIREAVEKWMKDNPMPKIVPKELEA